MTGFIRYRLSFGEQRHNNTYVHGLELYLLIPCLIPGIGVGPGTSPYYIYHLFVASQCCKFKTPFPGDSHSGLFPSRRRVGLGFLTFPFPLVATRPGGLSHCYGEFNVPVEAGCFVQVLPTINPALFLTWHQSVLNRNIHHEGIYFPIDVCIYDWGLQRGNGGIWWI